MRLAAVAQDLSETYTRNLEELIEKMPVANLVAQLTEDILSACSERKAGLVSGQRLLTGEWERHIRWQGSQPCCVLVAVHR